MSPIGHEQGGAVMLNLRHGQRIGDRSVSGLKMARWSLAVFCSLFLFSAPVTALDNSEFSAPEDARLKAVGDDLNINGLPTRVWEISSTRSPEEVLAFYRQEWQRPAESEGPGYIEKEAGGWQIISRSEDPYLYTVQLREAAMGSSFGFLAVSTPMELADHTPDEFARPAGSELLMDLKSDDAGKRGRVVQFKNRQSVEANYRFYRKRYMARGWRELSRLPADRNKALLVMNKGNGKASIVFSRINDESYGVVVESYD